MFIERNSASGASQRGKQLLRPRMLFFPPMLLTTLSLLALVCVQAEPLRVMTYNVRFPNPDDTPNRWDQRRELLVDSIREHSPDIFGTQELFFEQGEYIVEKLPEYAWFGISRRGNRLDEHMGVFYRKSRLRVERSGDFWLSETPEIPGSMSWKVSLPRMVSWAQFEDRTNRRRFWYFNTHFPHRGEDEAAREQCARVIAARLRLLDPSADILLTGDFNAPAGGKVYLTLADILRDAWNASAERAGPEGTFHGFTGKPGPARIDWIMFRGNWKVTRAETVTFERNGRFPSDHFPVLAVLE
jgi:endonuclease/exonuclease/phosphatase family metal-dependent hydrolase